MGQQQPLQASLLYEVGQRLLLPCGNVMEGQMCDQIQWWFKDPEKTQYVKIPQPGSALRNRQVLRWRCALKGLNVRLEDAGLYTCVQGGQEVVKFQVGVYSGE